MSTIKIKIQSIINYTNSSLKSWYSSAKINHGIIGYGTCIFSKENNSIQIIYTEYSETGIFEINDWETQNIEFAFNVWMEEANIIKDSKKFKTQE